MSSEKDCVRVSSTNQDSDISLEREKPKQSFWVRLWFAEVDHHDINKKHADVTLDLIQQNGGSFGELTPEKERKLKRKLWLTIVPIVFVINATLFLDKDAISYSSLLGVYKDMHMDSDGYNNVLTFFYVGYILGQIPSHVLFQRLPMSWYVTGTLAIWSILALCTMGCKSYKGLVAIRFFLGFFESGITPCIEHTLGMFFTPAEQAVVNPIFWISCLGIDVPIGFAAYGFQFVTKWRPWKWFWLFVGTASLLSTVFAFFFYPDNPARSRLFTTEEKIHIIQRVKKATRLSIELKVFKKYQFTECLKDPISWLFFFYALCNMLENSTTYQASTIYAELGFEHLTTTLLMVVQNGFSTCCAICGATALYFFKTQPCYVAAIWLMPSLLGAILAVSLPWSNKAGLLGGIFLTRTNGTAYIIVLSLAQASAAGYTKKLTRTLMFMIAYSISNIIAPQMWRSSYKPRYMVPWIIQIVFSWFVAPLLLLIIRYILSTRNKKRRTLIEQQGEEDYGFVETTDQDGNPRREKVDVSMLDLTDLENARFIYPL